MPSSLIHLLARHSTIGLMPFGQAGYPEIDVLALALASCGQDQLTSAETGTELEAIMAAPAGVEEMSEEEQPETVKQVSEQIGNLSEVASGPLADDLGTMSPVIADGTEGMEEVQNDPEKLEAYSAVREHVNAVCEI